MKNFFSVEHFPDDELYQVGRIQRALALATLGGLFVLIGYRLLIWRFELILSLLAISCVILVSLALIHKGHLKWSGGLLSWTLLGFLCYLLYHGDRIHDVAIAAVPGVLIIAALVLNRMYFFSFILLSLVSIVAICSPELVGTFTGKQGSVNNLPDIIDLVIILGITTVTIRVLSESFIRSLVNGRTVERELRKHVEQLEESAKRYQTLFEGASDAIFLLNGNQIIDCNTRALSMFGCSCREEILSSSPWDLSPAQQPDGSTSVSKAEEILRLARQGIHQSFYWKHVRKDGTPFDAEVSLNSTDLAGECVVQALVRDITERREAEERIIRSERHYRALVNTSPDAISISDLQGRVSFVSPNALAMFGVSDEGSVLGKPLLDWVAPEDRQRAADKVSQVMSGQVERHGSEYRMLKQDGSWFWTESLSTPLLDSNGNMTGILTMTRDIAKRKQSEQELQESEELHRKIITTVPDFIIRTDLEGYILFVNETAFPVSTPIAKERLLGRNLMSFVAEEDRARAIDNSKKMLDGQLGPRRYILVFEDGERVQCEVNGEVLRSSEGTPYGKVFVVRDVTKRKREEEERKKLELQLFHAQKLESIGTLAAGIAHDFNNILSIVMGNISLIAKNRGGDEKLPRRIDAIERAVDRGMQVVKQLLTYARKTPIVSGSVNINELIREVSGLMEATFPKTINVTFQLSPDLPSITGDLNQLHQVLINLCVNARDAMPAGGELTIVTQTVSGKILQPRIQNASAEQYVKISVADTGTGMTEETRNRIFDPFFTTKGAGKGTGLGLTMVHGIMENHSGFIDVASTPGKGTEFTLYLPTAEHDGEPKMERSLQFESVPGGTETILFVEDEVLAQEFVTDILRMKGYHVIIAGDGEEGMKMFERHSSEISMIISDIDMPKLNGEEFCRRVKHARPNLPLIVLSGFVDKEKKTSLTAIGVEQIEEKPFRMEDMLVWIRSILDRHVEAAVGHDQKHEG